MPKNLKEKVTILVEDIKTLNKYEAAAKVERFILDELQFLNTEHTMGIRDVSAVYAYATKKICEINTREDGDFSVPEHARAWCYFESTILHMRSKGLIGFNVRFDKKHK